MKGFDIRVFVSEEVSGGDAGQIFSKLVFLGVRVVMVDNLEKANLILVSSTSLKKEFEPDKGYVIFFETAKEREENSHLGQSKNIGCFLHRTGMPDFDQFMGQLVDYLSKRVSTKAQQLDKESVKLAGGVV